MVFSFDFFAPLSLVVVDLCSSEIFIFYFKIFSSVLFCCLEELLQKKKFMCCVYELCFGNWS